jgi:hypothetical protein
MPSRFALAPVAYRRGTIASHAAKSRPLRNAAPSPIAATMLAYGDALLSTGKVKTATYIVTCKRCARSISAGTQEFPRNNLVVQCTPCGELRRYAHLRFI